MSHYNPHETLNICPSLNDQQLRLNKISEVRDYFIVETKKNKNKAELMSKRLSKYIDSFDYFDKSLIVLSVTTDSISIASFATVIGAPTGITKTSLVSKY